MHLIERFKLSNDDVDNKVYLGFLLEYIQIFEDLRPLSMFDSKSFRSVMHDLGSSDEVFITALDRFIQFSVNIINNTEELREEIVDYDDVYQISLVDINFHFLFKISNGSIVYKRGLNRNASFKVRYTKEIFVKVLKREMLGTEAFMKGKIKVDGDLTQGLRFIKLFRIYIRYINSGIKKVWLPPPQQL
jgi:putative sterol carrier protein